MKTVTIVTLLVLSLSISAFAQTSSKEQKIRQMLELTGSAKIGVQTVNTMLAMFQKQYPNVSKEFWNEMSRKVKAEEIINLVTPIYAKYYTEEDLDQIILFYNSPAGKKVTATLPQITQETMEVGKAWGEKLAKQIFQEMQEKGYSNPSNSTPSKR